MLYKFDLLRICEPNMVVKRVYAFYSEQRFLFLLISILLLLLLSPLLKGFVRIKILLDIFFSMVFIFGVDAIRQDRKHLFIAIALAIPMLLVTWAGRFVETNGLIFIGDFIGITFFVYMIITILTHIFLQDRINREVIFAAVVVYLLMGVLWAFVYGAVEHIQPNSFSVTIDTIGDQRYLFLYYSFVTLTTLGYGDISPITAVASSMVILEAIIGQLYLVVQIAWLVGLRVSQQRGGNP